MISYENIASFGDIFSTEWLIIALVVAFVNTAISLPLGRKFFQINQQSAYLSSEYIKWLRRKDNIYISRLSMITLLSMLSYLTFSISLSFINAEWVNWCAFAFYILFSCVYIKSDRKRKNKSPLVFTHRMIRLIVTYCILMLIFNFAFIMLLNCIGFITKTNNLFSSIRLCFLCVVPLIIPIVVPLAAIINSPMEKAKNRKYIDRCKAKLYENKNLIKIGITGSYGKTSVKEILRSILEERYKVLATPASYNTPMGICKSVQKLDSTYDVFIAEMGARHEGEIKELVDIVKPTYGIINGIIEHHMDTFSSLQQVKRTKSELIRFMEDGVCVISADNENTISLKELKTENKIVVAGINKENSPSVFAENIEVSVYGSKFILNVDNKKIAVSTVLLGKHNVSNICLAVAIAHELGLSIDEIAAGISRIKPVRHRLELVSNERNITIIDDSYNSNVRGTQVALEVLSEFKGRKIVLTPGMVELGRFEDNENYLFGKRLSSVADKVILIGKIGAYRIYDGLVSEDFPIENIYTVKDLDDASEILNSIVSEGDVVLYENDLPDKFS